MTGPLGKPEGTGSKLLPVLSLTVVFDKSAGTANGCVGGSGVDVAVVVAASGGASAEELAVDASEASAPVTDATMLAMVEEA